MVNKALLNETLNISNRASGERKPIEFNKPSLLLLKTDTPSHITTLAGREHFLNLPIHIYKDPVTGNIVNGICNSLYKRPCGLCEALNDMGVKANPIKKVKAFPAYVHDYEGEQRVSKKSGRMYSLNPICVVLLRGGKGDANFKAMDELQEIKNKRTQGQDVFAPGRFLFQLRKSGSGINTTYSPLAIVDPEDLGDEFDPNSPQAKAALEEFKAKTPDQIYAFTLSALSNVDWQEWDLDEPVHDMLDLTKVSPVKGKSAKDALE
jgi:hypothetical protein